MKISLVGHQFGKLTVIESGGVALMARKSMYRTELFSAIRVALYGSP